MPDGGDHLKHTKLLATVRINVEMRFPIEWKALAALMVEQKERPESRLLNFPFKMPEGWDGELAALARAIQEQVSDAVAERADILTGAEGEFAMTVEAQVDEVTVVEEPQLTS